MYNIFNVFLTFAISKKIYYRNYSFFFQKLYCRLVESTKVIISTYIYLQITYFYLLVSELPI